MILVSLITVGYVGLGVRLVDIQVLQHDKHAAHALDNTRRKVIHASRRGDILDIRGTVLATSRIAKTVCADPSLPPRQVLRAGEPRRRLSADAHQVRRG